MRKSDPFPNPAPGPKWKAEKGINRMPKLNGAVAAVMACLIDHADDELTGIAWPSEPTIAKWVARCGPSSGRSRRLSS